MSKRLDPSGLAGAFAREKKKTSLDFLVPVKEEPHAPKPEAKAKRKAKPKAKARTKKKVKPKRPPTAKRSLPPPLPARQKRVVERAPHWAPATPPFPKPQWIQRVVSRRWEAWVGRLLRKVLTR